MPKRSASQPVKNAKASKKAKRFPRVTAVGNKAPQGRARYTKAKLTYAESVQINAGIGTAGVRVLAVNGLFDPDITGVGHQPAGFDQYMGLYNQYIVTKAWIKVCFLNTDTANEMVVGITPLDLSSTSGDFRRYIEQGTSKWTTLTPLGDSAAKATIMHEVNMREMSAQDIFNDDTYSGTNASNPANTHYFHVWVAATGALVDPPASSATIEIQYECYFRDGAFTDLS